MYLPTTAVDTLHCSDDLHRSLPFTTTTITAITTTASPVTSNSSMLTTTLPLTPTTDQKELSSNHLKSYPVNDFHPLGKLINGEQWYHTDENDNQMISTNEKRNDEDDEKNSKSNGTGHCIIERSKRLSEQKPHVKTSTGTTTTTTIRMKKWLSSADVKDRSSRRGSSDGVGGQRGHLIKNSNNTGKSTINLSRGKSISKLGPTSSSNISQISLSRFGLELREPSFLCDKGVLQVFVNGKTVHLPVPNLIKDLDVTCKLDPPTCEPTLHWVYGYRGKDCRGNLQELPTGEIIYFTGTVVVLHNPKEGSQRYYTKHTSDIKCMALHPNKLYVATGQTSRRFLEKSSFKIHRSPISSITELNNILETDQYKAHVRIWDSVTLQTLRTIGTGSACANFDRGVQCCAFSCAAADGMKLAIIDDSYEHILSVWQWQKGKKIAEIKSANDQVFACEFHPYNRNILMSYGKGHCNIWTIDRSTLIKKSIIFEGRNKPKLILCSHFTQRGHLITGDSNGTLTLWDINQIKPIQQLPKVHNGGVWALCLLSNGHFISAGKDRVLIEWKIDGFTKIRGPIIFPDEGSGCVRTIISTSSSSLFIGTTRNTIWCGTLDKGFQQIQQAYADAVTHITSHPAKSEFLSSADNKLRLHDTVTKTILWSLQFEVEICCIDFHPNGDIFAVGFSNGTCIFYKYTEHTELYKFEELNVPITAIRFSSVGNFIAIATKDKKLSIYAISGDFRHYVEVSQVTELNAPIKVMDWSTDGTLLRANDDNLQPYIWNSSTGQLASVREASKVEWSSARCPVSFENAFITFRLMKSVASIDRSPDQRHIAVALSNGILRFYQYPTTTIMASYKEVYGYCIASRNIAFVGNLLISDGGNDGAIYQWNLS